MRKALATVVLFQLIAHAHGAAAATNPAAAALTPTPTPTPEALGRSFMEHLSRGEFSQIEATYNEPIKRWAETRRPLETSWQDALRSSGAFQAIESVRQEPAILPFMRERLAVSAVFVTARFARGPRTWLIGFDKGGRIASFYANGNLSHPVGNAYVRHLSQHEYDAAFALSNAEMQHAAPPATLAKMWTAIEAANGAFQEITSVKNDGDATVVVAFADKSVTFSVCVDAQGKMCGFHILQVGSRSGLSTEPQLEFERQNAP